MLVLCYSIYGHVTTLANDYDYIYKLICHNSKLHNKHKDDYNEELQL